MGRNRTLTKGRLQGTVIHFANTTKSDKARTVPISKGLAAEIAQHNSRHSTDTECLFTSAYAAFLSTLDHTSIELPAGQASHVLRHTFASHFMMNGGNILTLQ